MEKQSKPKRRKKRRNTTSPLNQPKKKKPKTLKYECAVKQILRICAEKSPVIIFKRIQLQRWWVEKFGHNAIWSSKHFRALHQLIAAGVFTKQSNGSLLYRWDCDFKQHKLCFFLH